MNLIGKPKHRLNPEDQDDKTMSKITNILLIEHIL